MVENGIMSGNIVVKSQDKKASDETTVVFVSSAVNKVSSFVSEVKNRKGNIFVERSPHSCKTYKANELLFLEQTLKQA